MPIDILSMVKDPEFMALSPDDQRQLILTAKQQNAGGRSTAPQAPSGAFPWGGGTMGISTPAEAEASVAAIRDRVARGVADQPVSDLTIDIEKMSPPALRTTTTTGRPAPPSVQGGIEPLSSASTDFIQAEITRPAPLPVPPEMAIAAIPGMAGYALGARLAPLLGPVGKVVPPLLEAGGSYLGRKANVAMGYEQPGTTGDIAAAALPLAARGTSTAVAGMFERALSTVGTPTLDRLLSVIGRLGSGGSVGGLLYYFLGNPQLAAIVGGSVAGLRLFLDGVAETPIGRQLLTQTLATGRQLGGPQLSALVQIGRVKLADKLKQMQEAGTQVDTW
jgi:hypothetical protein